LRVPVMANLASRYHRRGVCSENVARWHFDSFLGEIEATPCEVVAKLSFAEFDGQPLGTGIQVVYFGGAFSALQKMEGCPMGSQVTAQYIIDTKQLTREQLDRIMAVLDKRDAQGQLIQPPVGENCTYKLILEKSRQPIPIEDEEDHG
jgi:hypothetical protein